MGTQLFTTIDVCPTMTSTFGEPWKCSPLTSIQKHAREQKHKITQRSFAFHCILKFNFGEIWPEHFYQVKTKRRLMSQHDLIDELKEQTSKLHVSSFAGKWRRFVYFYSLDLYIYKSGFIYLLLFVINV